MENGFKVLEADLKEVQVTLNTTASREHVPEIERKIRAIKERVRAIWNTLPYTRLPSRMISQMASYAVIWLNGLPVSRGVSSTPSHRTIVPGKILDFNKHFKIEFSTYAKTHKYTTPTNSMQSRTDPCICIGKTGNIQVSHWFLNLRTGRQIKCHTFTCLPTQPHTIS